MRRGKLFVRKSPRKSVAIDTSVLTSLIAKDDPSHAACLATLSGLPELTSFYTTESCFVETSFLLAERNQFSKSMGKLVEGLDIRIVPMGREGIFRACELLKQYAHLPMNFADASLVVACEVFDIKNIMTLNRRNFLLYKPLHCSNFELLPELQSVERKK